MSTPPLSEDARATALPPLMETGWQPVPGRDAIRKIWRFKGFPKPGASCPARRWRRNG